MAKKERFHSILLFLIISLFINSLNAQTSKIRNQIFIGARPMGMGETFVAIADDGNAIYWNPAGLASIDHYELQAMRTNLFNTGIVNNYVSLLMPNFPLLPYSEKLAFGLDWTNLGFDDDELEFSQNVFKVSVGYQFTRYLSLGFNAKYLYNSASLDGNTAGKASGSGFDFGLLISPYPRLTFGLMAHDFTNTRLQFENGVSETQYFRNIRFGASYKLPSLFVFKQPLLAIDIDDRFHLGAESWLFNIVGLRAGVQKDLSSYSEKELTPSFGTSIRYKSFQFDYAFTNSPFLENTHRFSLNLNFALPPSPIKIKSVSIEDIYASLYMYHQSQPSVVVELDYEGDDKIEYKIKLKENRFGISADRKDEIDPQRSESKKVKVTLNLSERVLDLPAGEKHTTFAEVTLNPITFISTKAEKYVIPAFNIYGPGTINWAFGMEQAAAFMPSEDESIIGFANDAVKIYENQKERLIINKNISNSLLIYNALKEYGILYRKDPNTPYSQSSKSVDNILYPYELLRTKKGDCDDTTVLYATLLESLGIHTALIAVPNHILMMFDTGIHEREQLMLCVDKDMYVVYKQHVWLPIETTYFCKEESFFKAWKKGAEQYYQSVNGPDFSEVDVHKAWQTYEPVSWERPKTEFSPPDENVLKSLYDSEQKTIQQVNSEFLEENFYKPLRNNKKDIRRINQLALINIWRGDIDEGVGKLKGIINE